VCPDFNADRQNKIPVKNHSRPRIRKEASNVRDDYAETYEVSEMNKGSEDVGATAKLMTSFVDRVRRAAAHDITCESNQNPVQRVYEICLSKLSEEDRDELVRVINKLSRHLDGN
jgi:hypothetical protein